MIARLCLARPSWPPQFPDSLALCGSLGARAYPGIDPASRKPAVGRAHHLGPGRQAPTIIGGSDP